MNFAVVLFGSLAAQAHGIHVNFHAVTTTPENAGSGEPQRRMIEPEDDPTTAKTFGMHSMRRLGKDFTYQEDFGDSPFWSPFGMAEAVADLKLDTTCDNKCAWKGDYKIDDKYDVGTKMVLKGDRIYFISGTSKHKGRVSVCTFRDTEKTFYQAFQPASEKASNCFFKLVKDDWPFKAHQLQPWKTCTRKCTWVDSNESSPQHYSPALLTTDEVEPRDDKEYHDVSAYTGQMISVSCKFSATIKNRINFPSFNSVPAFSCEYEEYNHCKKAKECFTELTSSSSQPKLDDVSHKATRAFSHKATQLKEGKTCTSRCKVNDEAKEATLTTVKNNNDPVKGGNVSSFIEEQDGQFVEQADDTLYFMRNNGDIADLLCTFDDNAAAKKCYFALVEKASHWEIPTAKTLLLNITCDQKCELALVNSMAADLEKSLGLKNIFKEKVNLSTDPSTNYDMYLGNVSWFASTEGDHAGQKIQLDGEKITFSSYFWVKNFSCAFESRDDAQTCFNKLVPKKPKN